MTEQKESSYADIVSNANLSMIGGQELPKNFQDRLEEMPAYTMTLNNLQSIYSTLKDKNEYIKSACNIGESVAGTLTSAAKPVVLAATDVAFKVAKPVIGEIKDPAACISGCASEMLAKVQEKLPFVKQTPGEIVEAAKVSVKDTANYYYDKMQSFTATQHAVKQMDQVVSLSDLMVELCFPTDTSNPDDIGEIQREEQDEDKGMLVHAGNVKRKAFRRGTKKLMTCRPVVSTVDMIQYVQNKISETTGMLIQGSNYLTGHSTDSTSDSNIISVTSAIHDKVTGGRNLLAESWDAIYKTSMYIPKKTLQVSGKVFVSTKEMVFAYSNAQSIMEMPHHIVEVAESYYKGLAQDGLAGDIKDKAVAFAYVPAQIVSHYIQSNRIVQWIVPNHIQTDTIQVIEMDNVIEDTKQYQIEMDNVIEDTKQYQMTLNDTE